MFLFVIFLFCTSTLFGASQHYMPLTVGITMTPDKEVYHPGDVIEVNFHAYFNDEIIEKDKDCLIKLHEKAKNPPTNLANAGLYLFNPEIFEAIDNTELSQRGEYEVTDSIQLLVTSQTAPAQ